MLNRMYWIIGSGRNVKIHDYQHCNHWRSIQLWTRVKYFALLWTISFAKATSKSLKNARKICDRLYYVIKIFCLRPIQKISMIKIANLYAARREKTEILQWKKLHLLNPLHRQPVKIKKRKNGFNVLFVKNRTSSIEIYNENRLHVAKTRCPYKDCNRSVKQFESPPEQPL